MNAIFDADRERKAQAAREKAARYRARHPDRVKASKAAYRSKPAVAEAEAEKFREWTEKNKERLNAARRERYALEEAYRDAMKARSSVSQKARRASINAARRKRRLSDPSFRLEYEVGNSIRRALKGKAGQSWKSICGYSAAELRAHLEAQFLPWMTWENYGSSWHVDHRRPIASFDLPADAAACWSLDNLRPLESCANMSKKAEIRLEEIPTHLWPDHFPRIDMDAQARKILDRVAA